MLQRREAASSGVDGGFRRHSLFHASCQTTCELQRQEQRCNSLAACYISYSGAPFSYWWMPSDELPESWKQVKEYRFLKILVKDVLNYSKGGKSVLNHLWKANDDLSKHPHVTNDYEWYYWCLTASTSRACPIMFYFTSCLLLQHHPPFIRSAVDMTEARSWRTFRLWLYFCFPM